jgi:hypothetical protein
VGRKLKNPVTITPRITPQHRRVQVNTPGQRHGEGLLGLVAGDE